MAPHGQDARLAALAVDAYGAVLHVDGAPVEADQLREAQPRGVEQFHDGLVAGGQGVVDAKFEQSAHLVHIERFGQAFARFGRPHLHRGIEPAVAFALQKPEEGAHRRQAALNAARRESAGVFRGGEGPHQRVVEGLPGADVAAPAEAGELLEIPPVGSAGVRAHAPFVRQMGDEPPDPCLFRRAHREPGRLSG